MDRGIITISETGVVTIPTAPVWMTKFEIADLFGVFSCDLRKAIHTIYKSKELNEFDTMKIALNSDLSYKLDGMTGAIMNGGTESSVVNNYYNNDNSRTVNQTNNSPKALSRLEIYRQTKNAVKV